MIGVVGPNEAAVRLAEAVQAADVAVGDAVTFIDAGADLVVASGDDAVQALATGGVDVPVLPVDTDAGLDPVDEAEAAAAVVRAVDGDVEVCTRPVVEIAIDGESVGRAVFEVMLVTSEPARISEYAVRTGGGRDQYRADGVVIATAAGSHGYARAVGGPVLDPDAASLAVVPIAAFAIRSSSRVASADATLTVSVERDEGDISLLVDGDICREVPTRRPVTVRTADVVETVVPPGRLEKP